MAKMYYEKDCDLNYLNGKKIAVTSVSVTTPRTVARP